ncbi:hypothetical protein AB5I41_19260 [Sphingomonas sp. MMS24-JH45]
MIVGVGQVNDRPADPMQGMEPLDLMRAALEAADKDAGGGWLADVDSVAVVQQISFRAQNPLAEKVGAAIGASPHLAYELVGPNGDSPILLLNEAANRIARGEITVAAVVGAEGRCAPRASVPRRRPRRRRGAEPAAQPGEERRARLPPALRPIHAGRRLIRCTRTRAAPPTARASPRDKPKSGESRSRFSQVAAQTPAAGIHAPRTPQEIVEPTADNRPIAFPYTKLMVANSSVNQGAGFLVTSLAEARSRGVPEERIVYVGRGASAHEADDFLARDRYDVSPSMEVCLRCTLESATRSPRRTSTSPSSFLLPLRAQDGASRDRLASGEARDSVRRPHLRRRADQNDMSHAVVEQRRFAPRRRREQGAAVRQRRLCDAHNPRHRPLDRPAPRRGRGARLRRAGGGGRGACRCRRRRAYHAGPATIETHTRSWLRRTADQGGRGGAHRRRTHAGEGGEGGCGDDRLPHRRDRRNRWARTA